MKNRSIIISAFTGLILCFIVIQNVMCCSMFKLTMFGKTMVGNNEDYWKVKKTPASAFAHPLWIPCIRKEIGVQVQCTLPFMI